MVIVTLIVLGICFGSFVNAVVWRFHEQETLRDKLVGQKPGKTQQAELDALSISKGRSMCVHCRHELAAKDLVPVLSYLWLRGRCRYCRKPIDDKPWSELATPVLFVVSYVYWPQGFSEAGLLLFCFWLAFLVGFVVLSIYDLRWYELPHDIVFWLICAAVVQVGLATFFYPDGLHTLRHAGLGLVTMVGIFGLLYRLSPAPENDGDRSDNKNAGINDDGTMRFAGFGTRALSLLFGWLLGGRASRWIGGGDVTLGALLGLIVGGPANALLLIFSASLLGTLFALPLLASGRATRASHLPFGPFLIAAAVIVMLWGSTLVGWYTGQFTAL